MNVARTLSRLVVALLVFPASYVANAWTDECPTSDPDIVCIWSDEDLVAKVNELLPGQTALLEEGTSTPSDFASTIISVSGTEENPIRIRGSGDLETIIDGNKTGHILAFDAAQHIIVENLVFTNLSRYDTPLDFDEINYSATGRELKSEGLKIRHGSRGITIRHCYFHDIATRGILANSSTEHLLVENNIFVRIGDDTSSGDIAIGGEVTHWTVRNNLFAGNIDGLVADNAGGGGRILRNLFAGRRKENSIDLKGVGQKLEETALTRVRENVIYADSSSSGITVQNGSDDVTLHRNLIMGQGDEATLVLRGRKGNVERIKIVGNWFDGGSEGGEGSTLLIKHNTPEQDGASIRDVDILHNVFYGDHGNALNIYSRADYEDLAIEGVVVDNNILMSSSTHLGLHEGDSLTATRNLFAAAGSEDLWEVDADPIIETPIFREIPGPLAEGSPGYGEAWIEPGRPLGNSVGIPDRSPEMSSLEACITQRLITLFGESAVREALEAGGREFHAPEPSSTRVCP
jgi:Right handed beta helix region